jgi:hypothetical protein
MFVRSQIKKLLVRLQKLKLFWNQHVQD